VNTDGGTKTVSLINTGVGPLTISGISLTGASDFAINSNTCGTTLAQGAQCKVYVAFKPKSHDSRSATLKITDNAQSKIQTVPMSGKGI
jgi:hypothetical protein